MTQPASQTVPLEAWKREHELRIQAEKDRDHWKNEFYLSRNLRRAPVLRPVDKDVLEEFRHVQKWGTVEDPEGNKRANYTTIANHLHISPDTVARSAERLEKLQLAEIREHQGPQDERERKYIQVKEEKLASIDKLEDPEQVVPKQGGNRYICPKCDSTDVAIKTVKTLHCNKCNHEEVVEDSGWKMQNGHKTQKQHAFETVQVIDEETGEVIEVLQSKHEKQAEDVKATCFSQSSDELAQNFEDEKQLAEHCVYTLVELQPAQKQVAFEELQALPQWVVWKSEQKPGKEKRVKVPYDVHRAAENARADVSNPATWSTYQEAKALYEKSQRWHTPYAGVGFVFKAGGGIVGIDYDNSLQVRINSYSEISVSGNGVHSYVRGSIPKGTRRNGIEMYDSGRFFTWTGNHLDGTPETIEAGQAELDALYKELAPEISTPAAAPLNFTDVGKIRSDDDILKKARDARNGAKFSALYAGNWSGYPSQSEADQALFEMLLYWTDGNVSTSDTLFRKSELKREKWERDDYRERTINRALAMWQRRERRAS